jgi:glycosyltransferase involved in cell wall biosynthesis
MEREVSEKGLSNVHFLRFRSDVPQLLQATDIFVLPSRREGLPRSIMEAMAAGKPVVATNVRGSRDLVEHEGTGLLVELGDVDGLAQALLQLIRDPKLRQKMGEAGRAKIRDYSLDRVLDEMSAIYARYLEI